MKRSLSKVFLMLLSSMSLIACANDLEIQEEAGIQPTSLDETTQAVGKSLSHSTIEEEITYIEMLVGVEELHAAKVALNGFLSELNGPVGTEEQLIRISQLKDVLSEVEVSEDGTHHHTFTAVDAVALAMERYGTDDEDIIYMYDDNHEHYGDDQIGYYVALKSKVLQEKEGGDGIVLLLFVGDDGSITEL